MITAQEAKNITEQNETLAISQALLLIDAQIKEAIKDGAIRSIEFSVPSEALAIKLGNRLRTYGYTVFEYSRSIRISW